MVINGVLTVINQYKVVTGTLVFIKVYFHNEYSYNLPARYNNTYLMPDGI